MTTFEPPGETEDRAVDEAAIRRVVADVAVAVVRGTFQAAQTAGATWIMTNEGGRWRCRGTAQYWW
jgi:hypothetical protein